MTQFINARSVDQLLAFVQEGAAPVYLHFWGHKVSTPGTVTKSCLSQWYEAPFTVENDRYPTAEHFMMAEKARLFGDTEVRAQVLEARTPAEVKALGRKVRDFEESMWNQARFDIVVTANMAKFSQNLPLRDFLAGTGRSVLVEASPVDRIWGIGLAADHPDASQPARWQGLNLLGFALMEVRSRLAPPH
ncbi:NADAR family protein [Acidovorax sp. NCPPB 3859]|nr:MULTISPECIES: NADAR family protein [unclassified Acidovorax]MDA8450262.1 NADAR family protein [Acidovorax sp. GBBC 3297]MDA8459707.1 NADAR family protein [Acidovorax sp. GBBC 3333]MDA8464743.1 NADAR family protein [Acidovorax sp. GBBC 3332]MDA8469798.1 NADAR family protein [Acidovorax sp. GBBC 3299]WCM78718.1 NADAR family protein [Acidovorax sp. GBBC 712]